MSIETFDTQYGKISIYKNDWCFHKYFEKKKYWDLDTLLKLQKFIDPDKNILEIGGHCGTSTIVYSSFLKKGKVYVYEPQKNMYNLLIRNIKQNNLEDKIIPFNKGVFCYTGKGKMNGNDLDFSKASVKKRYNEESHLYCNFGGISLGNDGEEIDLITIDDMKHDNIGFIHCDAQGSENYIFSKSLKTIKKFKPNIYYEDNYTYYKILYNQVYKTYPKYKINSLFNIKVFCMENLNYQKFINNFNNSPTDNLLINYVFN
jgi:FkbM family methyltransferase